MRRVLCHLFATKVHSLYKPSLWSLPYSKLHTDFNLNIHNDGAVDVDRELRESTLRQRLLYCLKQVYWEHMLLDPQQKSVIVCEDPLMPSEVRDAIAGCLSTCLKVSNE
jgi:hypothetical protein